MNNIIIEDFKRKAMKVLGFILICMICIPISGMTVEAGTTCKSKISYPGTTTAQVNMRKKAGTNYKSYGMLDKGQEVTILGWCKNKGVKWYKCKAVVKGKNKTGYISSAYIKQKSKPKAFVNSKVTSKLNVRKSAKTSAKSLIKIPSGTQVTILGIKSAGGNYWYKVKVKYNKKTKTGYVLSKYITLQNTNSGSATTPDTPTQEEQTGYVNDKVTSTLNVREKASTSSTI